MRLKSLKFKHESEFMAFASFVSRKRVTFCSFAQKVKLKDKKHFFPINISDDEKFPINSCIYQKHISMYGGILV